MSKSNPVNGVPPSFGDVQNYATEDPTFPYQSTANRFFYRGTIQELPRAG